VTNTIGFFRRAHLLGARNEAPLKAGCDRVLSRAQKEVYPEVLGDPCEDFIARRPIADTAIIRHITLARSPVPAGPVA